jgi:hypothetical protein
VLRQVIGTRADAPPWGTVIPRCASIARKHGSDGEALADTCSRSRRTTTSARHSSSSCTASTRR